MECPICGGDGRGLFDLPLFTLDEAASILDDLWNDFGTSDDLEVGETQMYQCQSCGKVFE